MKEILFHCFIEGQFKHLRVHNENLKNSRGRGVQSITLKHLSIRKRKHSGIQNVVENEVISNMLQNYLQDLF